ncbi:hypothetical protein [Cytobacillus oceanisediminis]|uniref:hypothetical protein n=1 Tax=Cytobacillus oceanisediminis TaxID=665099 RepID=UPI0039EF9D80
MKTNDSHSCLGKRLLVHEVNNVSRLSGREEKGNERASIVPVLSKMGIERERKSANRNPTQQNGKRKGTKEPKPA